MAAVAPGQAGMPRAVAGLLTAWRSGKFSASSFSPAITLTSALKVRPRSRSASARSAGAQSLAGRLISSARKPDGLRLLQHGRLVSAFRHGEPAPFLRLLNEIAAEKVGAHQPSQQRIVRRAGESFERIGALGEGCRKRAELQRSAGRWLAGGQRQQNGGDTAGARQKCMAAWLGGPACGREPSRMFWRNEFFGAFLEGGAIDSADRHALLVRPGEEGLDPSAMSWNEKIIGNAYAGP